MARDLLDLVPIMTGPLQVHAIILATGRGAQVRDLTSTPGEPVEKQFCRFGSSRTLIQRTVERLAHLRSPSHETVVVRDDHMTTAFEQLEPYSRTSVFAQPGDRGTGVAALVGMLAGIQAQPAITIISPADHGFCDERMVRRVLSRAIDLSRRHHAPIVIGARPDRPRTDCGWIVAEPGRPECVSRLVETPDPETASQLARSGGLFNTMLLVSPTVTLLEAFESLVPDAFSKLLPSAFHQPGERSRFLRWAFGEIDAIDFSRDIVARMKRLRAVTLPESAGWSDLGDVARVLEWLDRRGARRAGFSFDTRAGVTS